MSEKELAIPTTPWLVLLTRAFILFTCSVLARHLYRCVLSIPAANVLFPVNNTCKARMRAEAELHLKDISFKTGGNLT